MLFNSAEFVVFFIVVSLGYHGLPSVRLRTWWLLAASCLFYMAFVPAYITFLFAVIIVDYVVGRVLPSMDGRAAARKAVMTVSVIANIGLLATFKYFDFVMSNVESTLRHLGLHEHLPRNHWLLPIGLSFHTFQALSYTIEVYKGRYQPEKNLPRYALYVLFYPQLVAGPIERPQNILPQLVHLHGFDRSNFSSGCRLMVYGLFKKMVIADSLALIVNEAYGRPHTQTPVQLAIATAAFAVQIYCDFSGYSDIARGLARTMNVELMVNFKNPYLAKSVSEFWRRWHISLSTWFRDYVYIPLGGSRVGAVRRALNVLIVFGLSGLWHGANWTFVIWGALNGVFIVTSERSASFRNAIWERLGALARVRTMLARLTTAGLITLTWVFFRAATLQDAWWILHELTIGLVRQISRASGTVFPGSHFAVGWGALLALGLLIHEWRSENRPAVTDTPTRQRLRPFAYGAAAAATLAFGIFPQASAFIYFQF